MCPIGGTVAEKAQCSDLRARPVPRSMMRRARAAAPAVARRGARLRWRAYSAGRAGTPAQSSYFEIYRTLSCTVFSIDRSPCCGACRRACWRLGCIKHARWVRLRCSTAQLAGASSSAEGVGSEAQTYADAMRESCGGVTIGVMGEELRQPSGPAALGVAIGLRRGGARGV